jgi:hypothetical protein
VTDLIAAGAAAPYAARVFAAGGVRPGADLWKPPVRTRLLLGIE